MGTKAEYRSAFERNIASNLKRRRVKFRYESRTLNYTLKKSYLPDFELPNGILIEAKGYFKPSDRQKMLAVRRCNPDLDIRLLFMDASNKLSKRSKTTYGKWATKHGFIWAEGIDIPSEWISEKRKK